MILRFIFCLFFTTGIIYSQSGDSVYFNPASKGITDTTKADTTGLLSTKKEIAGVDTIRPLYQKPLYPASEFIDRKEIDFLDYRYAGNFFLPFGLSFLRNYGFVGHPNELMLYGTNDVSFFENGVYANDRSSLYFNLYLIPSEMIDSVEIIPAPRGFLYGPVNSPVGVNFIRRDILSVRPYTRIKYYEGPSGEAYIDAIFNAIIYKDLVFTLDISNRKVDLSYTNSDFSIWQGEAHMKYLLSDDVNITGSYGYNDYEAGMNGGVNIDSINQISTNIDQILYDEQLAPVNYPQRRLNILQHKLGLRLFANPVSDAHTDLSIYYRFSNDEVSNPPEVATFPQRTKDKTTGAVLRQGVSIAFANLNVTAQYEKTDSKYYIPGAESDFNRGYFTLSPVLSLSLLDSTFIPSAYYKFQNIHNGDSKSYNGIGFDVSFNPLKYLKLYGGYSNYKSAGLSNNVNTVEFSAKLKLEELDFGVDFINRGSSYFFANPLPFIAGNKYYLDLGTTQLGGNLSVRLWKILLEASSYYDLSKHDYSGNLPVVSTASPKIKLTGGIYLNGYFFEDNLKLKTGFAVNYNSKQRIFSGGKENDLADKFITLDFTLAGEIQKVAIAYFTWENLFDKTYYIVPYYPMFRRGIRFGVAWELFN